MTLTPKEILLIIVLIALTCGGIYLYRHGEQHIETQDAKLAALAQAKVATVETTAKDTESQSAIIYKQAVIIPAVGDIGDECVRKPSSSSVVPAASGGTGAATSQPSAVGGGGLTFDPSGAILTRAREADAQIVYLQARIRELEAEMNGAP